MPSVPPAPTYYLLADELRRRILTGQHLPGSQLPTEAELCRNYSLSRGTVIHALELLVREGLIERRQGRGTFVTQPRIEQTTFHILDFSDDMRRRGRVPGTRLLHAALEAAPPDVGSALQLGPDEPMIRIERLRLADGEPMAVETRFLKYSSCPELLSEDLEGESIHRLLIEKYRLPLIRAQFTMSAALLHERDAVLLGVQAGSAGLRVERLTFTVGNQPVSLMVSTYRGDEYRLTAEIGPMPSIDARPVDNGLLADPSETEMG